MNSLAIGPGCPDASWGTIFLIVTLCFVEDPAAVIREAHRLLQPGGKAVLGLVLRESPWGQFYQAQKEAGHRFYRWATFYTFEQEPAVEK